MKCLQEQYAPHNACFGCGPSNPNGLHVKSFVEGSLVVATWIPKPHHEAFPGVLNGGIIGAILDCHSNWTAAWHLMALNKQDSPPCTVTANYSIKLFAPTPTHAPLKLEAQVKEIHSDKATIEAKLLFENKVTATCMGLFVAVKPGHPAYHRW